MISPPKEGTASKSEIEGLLLGTAIGDSLGLPAEGLSPRTIERIGWKDNWHQRFLLRWGMLSDDTEHTLLVAQCLSKCPSDSTTFTIDFSKCLKRWFCALPAGVGLATSKAILRQIIGISPQKSGVYSAGNGPAMRSAIIGLIFQSDLTKIQEYVRASTEITHTDPKAYCGALAVAISVAKRNDPEALSRHLENLATIDADHWPEIFSQIQTSLARAQAVSEFAEHLGIENGPTGYVYHSVPVALFAWLKWRHDPEGFAPMMKELLNCGGDTDTTGAIAGALMGASVGREGIPTNWIRNLRDWPYSVGYINSAATDLSENRPISRPWWCFHLMRNLLFLPIVLCHGFARLVPAKLRRKTRR